MRHLCPPVPVPRNHPHGFKPSGGVAVTHSFPSPPPPPQGPRGTRGRVYKQGSLFPRREQRGGLDKFYQVPGAPQKSWLPSPPTTGDRRTGTLQRNELSIASAETGTFLQQSSNLEGLPHFPGWIPASTQQHPCSQKPLESQGPPWLPPALGIRSRLGG